ncbi:hypothetical protein RKE29_13325 [Streptomyces sp. B1866]|uniref:hypothetical protein n=1 Tax=Streptomyces sp. B1866 TaxID=3075431 RepID=UPI00289007FD|nr:hypothetical protein [Streptomyces sp. B1866]MDT3397621.1 hypothetical protein [Streptomyces sp. B1866]
MTERSVDQQVDALMLALEDEYADAARTLGGVSWLHVHQVPVRRLLRRVVRRLSLQSDAPNGTPLGKRQGLVTVENSASFGYVIYDISGAGIRYLLDGVGEDLPVVDEHTGDTTTTVLDPLHLAATPVCAVSWSSRHADTLLPVLGELADRGLSTTVVDLATEPDQRFPAARSSGITVLRAPVGMLAAHGGLPAGALSASAVRRARVGPHEIPVSRLARLSSLVVLRSAGCTQPSWAAALWAEAWLDRVLAESRSRALLCCNDISPLGVLAVRAAERVGADTVYVQHGAWASGQVAWRVRHCRHIAVMGARDVVTAQEWPGSADARIHAVGQPRFDALATADRARQRAYLERLLADQAGTVPERIAVWACQPTREPKLTARFEAVADGVRKAGDRWGLVVAPHPAQRATAFAQFPRRTGGVAVAEPEVGARGCLAGADALLSASSTCGIEALLLDVPVLELALSDEPTLALADHGAAQRCTSGAEMAAALRRVDRTPEAVRVPAAVKKAVCRWDGRAAAAVADIVTGALTPPRPLAATERQ